MIVATFEIKEHEEYGGKGLAMVGRDWADPFAGMAAAHDMLEHFPKDDGSTEHELMALGASYHVRDESNYYAAKGQLRTSPGYNWSGDLAEQNNYMIQRGDGEYLRDPPRTTREDEYFESEIETAIGEARKDFDPGDLPGLLKKSQQWKIYGWMRLGYRRAKRRYAKSNRCFLLSCFMEIERLADQFIKYGEEGQRCKIIAEPRRGDARLIELPYGEYGY